MAGNFEGFESPKGTIPIYIAKWLEKCREMKKTDNQIMNDAIEGNAPQEVKRWLINADYKKDLYHALSFGYEIKEEQKYYLEFPKIGLVNHLSEKTLVWSDCFGEGLTKVEILEIDPRYWKFAFPVKAAIHSEKHGS